MTLYSEGEDIDIFRPAIFFQRTGTEEQKVGLEAGLLVNATG